MCIRDSLKIGYLSQNSELNEENTVFDELLDVYHELHETYVKIQKLNERLATDLDNFDEIMEELSKLTSKYEQEEGYAIEYKVKQILNGLSIPEAVWNNKIADLSGGQR